MASTLINDAPLIIDPEMTGGQIWEPKNYDSKFEGPMRLRQGLAKSKNIVSIRILQTIGPPAAQAHIKKFGFDADKHPPYLTMALGAGSVTPWQLLGGYAVFANGGYRVAPYIDRPRDRRQRQDADGSAAAARGRQRRTRRRCPQRLRDGQPAARRHQVRHRGARRDAQAARYRRQDRHDQRLPRRLVCWLRRRDRCSRVDGLRPAAPARRSRDRRRTVPADLDVVHGTHAQDAPAAPRFPCRLA